MLLYHCFSSFHLWVSSGIGGEDRAGKIGKRKSYFNLKSTDFELKKMC